MKRGIIETPYVIRSIPQQVDRAISAKFEGKRFVGHTSPRQGWMRALIFVGALDIEVSCYVYQLWQRSLQIASRRGDAFLRDESLVRLRYEQEFEQLAELLPLYEQSQCRRVDVANRLANVLYYAVHIFVYDGNISAFERACMNACDLASLPLLVALQIASEKYTSRGHLASLDREKDSDDEERRMQRVLDEFLLSEKIDMKTS